MSSPFRKADIKFCPLCGSTNIKHKINAAFFCFGCKRFFRVVREFLCPIEGEALTKY